MPVKVSGVSLDERKRLAGPVSIERALTFENNDRESLMDALPPELLELIIVSYFIEPRAVCKHWRDIVDDVLRRECETDLNTMLENCRVCVLGSEREGWIRRRILRYRFLPYPRYPKYKCGACGNPVTGVAMCECHTVL